MKKIVSCFLLMIVTVFSAIIFHSCDRSLSGGDAEALLKTVPAEVSAVAVVNVESVMKKLDVTSKNGEFVLPSDLQSMLDPNSVNEIKKIKGVELTALVGFVYRNTFVLTGYCSDVEAFKKFVADEVFHSAEWVPFEDIEICETVAVSDRQFWVVSRGVAAQTIMGWTVLKEGDSAYKANELVADLANLNKDIKFTYDVDRVMNVLGDNLDMEQRMAIKLAKEMYAVDFAHVAGWLNFGDNEVEAEMNCYSSKFDRAEFAFELDEIDASLLSKMPKNSDVVVAYGTSSKLWATIASSISQYLGNVSNPQQLAQVDAMVDAVRSLDGTIMIGGNVADLRNNNGEIAAVIQTKDAQSARKVESLLSAYQDMFGELSFSTDNNLVRLSYGVPTIYGRNDIKSVFSGNIAVIYVDGSALEKGGLTQLIESIIVTCDSMDHGKLEVKIKKSSHANSLKAIVVESLKNN